MMIHRSPPVPPKFNVVAICADTRLDKNGRSFIPRKNSRGCTLNIELGGAGGPSNDNGRGAQAFISPDPE